MTRAATAPELVKLASDGQWSDVFAFISSPPIVLACRVNEASPANDKRARITFDGITAGAYTGALDGMTVLVGSAAGLSDRGIACLNGNATDYYLPIIQTSTIAISDNDYITVIAEFGIWAKRELPAYSNQLSTRKPTIEAGGDMALELIGASVAVTKTWAGASTYVTTCAGATVTNSTTSTPTVTINAAGEYLVKIVGTGSNGAVSTTYRIIYVYDAAHMPKNVILSSNSADEGGWNASLQLYENISAVRDRAKVVIFARDYYAGVLGSVGSLSGCENVVSLGWIAGKTINYDADNGSVSFEVQPASWWLGQVSNPDEVQITGTSGSDWKHIASLSADLMIWFLLEWRTTALNSMDLVLTGDTRTSRKLTIASGSMWSQITDAGALVCCTPTVNQYGQIICAIDTPLIPIADRAGIPVVVTLTAADFESIDIEQMQTEPTGQTVITGELSSGKVICSLGGGHIPGRFGDGVPFDGLMATDQTQFNVLAGSLYAKDNTPYRFGINNLRGNNRLIEPGNRIGLTLTGADNLAGIAYSGYAIVRGVDRSHDPETGAWTINLDADAETQAVLYTTGQVAGTGFTSGIGTTPPIDFGGFPSPPTPYPPTPPVPPTIPPVASACTDASPATGPYVSQWERTWIDGSATPGNRVTRTWQSCTVRAATATYPSYLEFQIQNVGEAYNHLHCYGIDGSGARIVTGTVTATTASIRVDFTPVSPITVAGFELECDEGLDFTPADGVAAFTYTPGYWGENFIKISYYGTDVDAPTTTKLIDSPAAGILQEQITAHGITHFAGTAWEQNLIIYPEVGSIGTFYMMVSYNLTSSGAYRPYRFIGVSPYSYLTDFSNDLWAMYVVAEITTPATLGQNFQFNTTINTNPYDPAIEFSTSITWSLYYSKAVPARSVSLGPCSTYNVCPAVAA